MRFAFLLMLFIPQIAQANPTAKELLDKYAATADKAFASYIYKSRTVENKNIYFSGKNKNRPNYKTKRKKYYEHEYRTDGTRVKKKTWMWGQVYGNSKYLSEDKKCCVTYVWAGDQRYQYGSSSSDYPGYLSIKPDGPFEEFRSQERIFATSQTGASSLGYMIGDGIRLEVVLNKASDVFVRNKMEQINGISHYVIEAKTERGEYTVWLDPKHGYNFSKVIVKRKGGDKWLWNEKVDSDGICLLEVTNTEFKKIDGIWVPTKADIKDNRVYKNGDYVDIKMHFEINTLQINPDHDALCSFSMDDIPNGAKTRIWGIPDRYIWQNGKVVDENGNEVKF